MINMEFNKGFFDKLFKQTVAIPLLHQNNVWPVHIIDRYLPAYDEYIIVREKPTVHRHGDTTEIVVCVCVDS